MARDKSVKKSKLLILLIIVVVVIVGLLAAFICSLNGPYQKDNTEMVEVEIPMGSGTAAIAQQLEESGIIKSALAFRIKSKLAHNDGEYRCGTFSLSASMTTDEIMETLKSAVSADTERFTVPEGSNLTEIASIIADTGVCTADDFLKEAASGQFDYDFLADAPSGEKRLEGFLYPDTYEIYANESAHNIIDMMLARFDEIYSEVAEGADSEITKEYSTFELVTIASMIEKEAKLDDERPLVASVIYNRLEKGMKLQFCSTVQYALGKHKERLYNSDLKVDSPYNTYIIEGLPAGPISSPGKASLEAALAPADTDYLYFVVSSAGDGSHNFAKDGDDFASYKEEYLESLAS
jgi:UPF0755 protein